MLFLDSNDPVPLYKQLYMQIRENILSGKWPADFKLPSVRALAHEISTSRNTVEGAYQELHAEGYVYSKQRSGYFVAPLDLDQTPLSSQHKKYDNEPFFEVAPTYTYDFHPARLDPASFPTKIWRKLFIESLRENSRQLSQYSDPQGDMRLRISLQEYLDRSRGVVCEPDQIVLTSGLQQSLDIVATLLKKRHSVIAFENPGYPPARFVFRNHSYETISIPVGPKGIELNQLKASQSTIVYVTPSHQLPLGYVMPVANRLKLIDWAETGDRFILEDDYDSELRYSGKPIPSLQGLRPDGNIFYMGTFSKILSPALRMSYLVLPQSQMEPYRHLYQDFFPSVSMLEQLTLTKFLEQGHWERQIRRMRTIYKKKHDAILQAIERYFGTRAMVVGQGAGLHVVLQLPENSCGETQIIERARQIKIRLIPFSWTCDAGSLESTKLMLGFGEMTISEIELGIRALHGVCF
jgi:GntR family transcriptional regulator/MocR family aminotransferase